MKAAFVGKDNLQGGRLGMSGRDWDEDVSLDLQSEVFELQLKELSLVWEHSWDVRDFELAFLDCSSVGAEGALVEQQEAGD